MRDFSKFVELETVKNSFWWTNYIDGVSFDGEEFGLPKVLAMTDTGTSCSYFPQDIYEVIIQQVTSKLKLTHD